MSWPLGLSPGAARNKGKLTRATLHTFVVPSFFSIITTVHAPVYGGSRYAMRAHERASGFVSAGSLPVHVIAIRFFRVPAVNRRIRRSFGSSFVLLTIVCVNAPGWPFASRVACATHTFTPPVSPFGATFDVFRYVMKMWLPTGASVNVTTDGSSSSTVAFVTRIGNGRALARTSTRTGTKSDAGVGRGSFELTARRSNS